MKVVINERYGGFELSKAACERLGVEAGVYNAYSYEDRSNPALVKVVEELGIRAGGPCAKLVVIEIPDDTDYTIEEYDGNEWVAEKHRTWP